MAHCQKLIIWGLEFSAVMAIEAHFFSICNVLLLSYRVKRSMGY